MKKKMFVALVLLLFATSAWCDEFLRVVENPIGDTTHFYYLESPLNLFFPNTTKGETICITFRETGGDFIVLKVADKDYRVYPDGKIEMLKWEQISPVERNFDYYWRGYTPLQPNDNSYILEENSTYSNKTMEWREPEPKSSYNIDSR